MEFYEQVAEIIGSAPVGYEPLQYIVTAFIFIFILVNCFILLGGIIKKVGDM